MDNKRTRLRSQAAVSKVFPAIYAPASQETLEGGAIVEVEVEGEHDRGLPVVRGVNKRKRDPRGAGRRLQQKIESQEGSVSVVVDDNANASSEEIRTTERHGSNSSNEELLSSAATPTAANTYVIIPDIMPQDQAVMKHLDKRRESSRLRVKPSKFREGFLLSNVRPKGDQKGADDVTTALEIVLPMDVQNTGAGVTPIDHARASSSRVSESEIVSRLERPSHTSSGKNKFKITYKSGAARATEISGDAADSSMSGKKGVDDVGLKAALGVLKRIMQIKSAEPFNEPVDPVVLEIPDYFDVIEEPMDLGTIRELLEGGKKYKTVKDVFDDVQLVWSNCRNYNQEGDPIMDILKIAENCFNKYWNAAGLPVFSSDTKVPKQRPQKESSLVEPTDELVAAPEQLEGEDAKRRKSKDSKSVVMMGLSKIAHFDPPNSKAKIQRSASVEQVMAESKAREDKLEVEDVVLIKEDSNSSQGHADDEVVEEEQSLGKVDEGLLTSREAHEIQAEGQCFESEVNAVKISEVKLAEMQNPVDQEAKTPFQEKDNSLRGSSSNKRRTFGTVHHKPDCSCVVCVGRRRKLAREEKEGIEGTHVKKDKSKSHTRLTQETHVMKPHVSKVSRPPKPPQLQEAVAAGAVLIETEIVVEPDRSDSQMGNSVEVDALVEGVRYYPATYELPLRKVSPSLFHFSQVLFHNNYNNVWSRHHSLGYRFPPPVSKSSMFEAVNSLTLKER